MQIAVMGAKGAVDLLYKNGGQEGQAAALAAYEEKFNSPFQAAKLGYVDAVIPPRDTRRRVCAELALLRHKQVAAPRRKHANMPL
jgi:propionyl-CoA carboxylase beta chain